MVRAHNVFFDPGALHMFLQLVADEEIIDSPADIAFACAGFHVPPGVVAAIFFEEAERVVVAGRDELIHPFAFDRQEPADIRILFRARKIQFRVRRVDIAAEHDRFFLAERLDQVEKAFIKLQLVFQPLRPHLAVRKIHVEKIEFVELEQDDASFAVQKRVAEGRFREDRRNLGIDARAAVSAFYRRAPVRFVSIGMREGA